jgi:hypothetical protein
LLTEPSSITCPTMPCYCAANTLRLFIRSVAHVDVPVSTKLVHSRQIQRSSIRSFRSPTFQDQYKFSSRNYSSTTSSNGQYLIDSTFSSQSQSTEVKKRGPDETGPASNGHTNPEGAFVDFSPDAIDAIAAESRSEPTFEEYDTSAELVSNVISRQARHGQEQQSGPIFRRTKVENTGFKLHLSAPRLPRISKSVKDSSSSTSTVSISKPSAKQSSKEAWTPRRREHWQIDKDVRREKYPDGWNPQKRLSPDAIAGIRALHSQMPEKYHTRALAENFQVSPEAISKILRTKWVPSPEEESDRQRRWFKRGESVWSRYAELGIKPPKRWRELGIGKGKPEWMTKKESGVKPALVTLPRRDGGVYKLGNETESDSLEDRIL